MTNSPLALTRRTLLAGAGSALLAPLLPQTTFAQAVTALELQAKSGPLIVRPGTSSEAGTLHSAQKGPLRFNRGDEIDVQIVNQLPGPIVLNCRGINAVSGIAPLLDRKPIGTGARDAFKLTMRSAGTSYVDMRLLGDGAPLPSQVRSMVVQETDPLEVDRDEVLLIEDFRIAPDGKLLAPGVDPKDAAVMFLANRKAVHDIPVKTNERLRLRLINGCQRSVIAIKFEDQDVRVMAIDGQPAEPFPARNNQVVLAPGTRIDVFLDTVKAAGTVTAILLHDGKDIRRIGQLVTLKDPPLRAAPLAAAPALPANDLPAQIDLKSATRADLAIGTSDTGWLRPLDLGPSTAPAFKARSGRPVVLTLANKAAGPVILQMHGHHFRLLDRLDDGWKPFWLDTLALDPGQTQRIAFTARNPGRWLIESFVAEWAAPRLVRWYEVG
ncbi:copper oxidase [Rhodopseudomonas boonkerdii]|uniref:multicopper oxidase family protein n=1 Tax=Rhodopseudomonas boonkerdii TaxID=475937 RepID=UPI001E63D198|nr:multicopper oxidase domain-containing protein [Rhodopseudomonas boonkerdii]UGV26463.1 copper oxidase [Rhodopseudomonas boonkerdii]